MNTYSCWYQGKFGYSCRFHTGKWMFVPEMGQIDSIIHRNLTLDELTFKNASEKSYEMINEKRSGLAACLNLFKSILFPPPRSRTIGGMLLTAF